MRESLSGLLRDSQGRCVYMGISETAGEIERERERERNMHAYVWRHASSGTMFLHFPKLMCGMCFGIAPLQFFK